MCWGWGKGAAPKLIAYLASQPSGWNSKIGEMLIGQITERDFLAQAASVVNPSMAELQQKEAWYYAGMKRLLAGDKTATVDDFRKCVSIQNRLEPEDSLAVAELVKLGVGE